MAAIRKFFTPVKVGLLTLTIIAATMITLRSVEEGALGSAGTYRVYAILDNVLGVAKRSRVVVAGIEVGYIESIDLVGGRARLNLRIRNDVPLYADASLAKVSESLLGDKIIDINPGKDVEHPLGNGGEIKRIYEEKDFSEIFRTLDGITRDIQGVTSSLNETIGKFDRDDSLGGVLKRLNEISVNVAELSRSMGDSFERGSEKVDRILDDIGGVTSRARGRFDEILDNVHQVSAELRRLVANINDIVGRGEGEFKEGVSGVKDTLEKAGKILERVEGILYKIDEGQGTIGRLVNDDRVISQVENVLDDASSLTRPLSALQIGLNLHSEYLVQQNAAKNYVGLELRPKSDKAYIFELIDDPRGKVSVVETCVNTTDCPPEQRQKEIRITDDLKWSLQFAKRLAFLQLRFGIIEGSGGLGANFYAFQDDLELKLDLFQFGKNEFGTEALPRLKAQLIYRPRWLEKHLYFTAGGDDFFNSKVIDYFFGAGIEFTDSDLKAIITATGVPKP